MKRPIVPSAICIISSRELVAEGFAWLDDALGEAGNPVHAVRQQEPVPVDARAAGQFVRHVDAHPIALDRLDRRTVNAAIVAPARGLEPRRELVLHFFGDEMVHLYAVYDLPRQ
jgi:hypothetical protein